MEHKLIQGGEQYLPFARSRVKALRATGQKYVSQQFVMPDGEVRVQLVGEHEYIRISGGEPAVLSGVTRDGDMVTLADLSGEALRSYKPTEQARRLASIRTDSASPATFNDEKKLKVGLATHLHGDEPTSGEYGYYMPGDSQYKHLAGSMYSGRMSKLVQLVMGYGRTPRGITHTAEVGYEKRGVSAEELAVTQILYDYRWARCHGVTVASDGKLWLVEIGMVNGVIAMPLPMRTRASYAHSRQDVLRQAGVLFNGLPSGATFPADEDLEAAISEGSVIRLATAAHVDPFFSKPTYSSALGWSFNDDGTEAHNTCWYYSATESTIYSTPKRKACHYKIAISIGATVTGREANQPVASGEALLSLVEEAWMVIRGASTSSLNVALPTPFKFHEPIYEPGYSVFPDVLADADHTSATEGEPGFPIFVCHRNGVLEVIRVCWVLTPSLLVSAFSDSFPLDFGVTSTLEDSWYLVPDDPTNYYFHIAKSTTTTNSLTYGAMWPSGVRDGYVLFETGKITDHAVITVFDRDFLGAAPPHAYSIFNGDSFGYDPSTSYFAVHASGEGTLLLENSTADRAINLHVAYSWGEFTTPRGAYADYPGYLRTLWGGGYPIATYQYFPRFYMRFSTFGTLPQVVYSAELIFGPDFDDPIYEGPPIEDYVPLFGDRAFHGTMVEDEETTELPNYSFVGYI